MSSRSTSVGKPFRKASRRTFKRPGTVLSFPSWNSPKVASFHSSRFSDPPPWEALKKGLPASVYATDGSIQNKSCAFSGGSWHRILGAKHQPAVESAVGPTCNVLFLDNQNHIRSAYRCFSGIPPGNPGVLPAAGQGDPGPGFTLNEAPGGVLDLEPGTWDLTLSPSL
jgi:hypothetical protein